MRERDIRDATGLTKGTVPPRKDVDGMPSSEQGTSISSPSAHCSDPWRRAGESTEHTHANHAQQYLQY